MVAEKRSYQAELTSYVLFMSMMRKGFANFHDFSLHGEKRKRKEKYRASISNRWYTYTYLRLRNVIIMYVPTT